MDQSIIKSLHHMFCLDSRDAHAFLAWFHLEYDVVEINAWIAAPFKSTVSIQLQYFQHDLRACNHFATDSLVQ